MVGLYFRDFLFQGLFFLENLGLYFRKLFFRELFWRLPKLCALLPLK